MGEPKNRFLYQYLETADATTSEILRTAPEALALVEECDELISNLVVGRERFLGTVTHALALNAHFLYLASVRISLSGHPAATYPTLRTALESACYALLIEKNEQLAGLWQKRHESEEDLRAHKRAFGSAVPQAAKLAGVDDDFIRVYITSLYEAAIDFGGHPNPRAMLGHAVLGDDETLDEFGCLYPWGKGLCQSLLNCVEFGIAIICLLAAITNGSPLLKPSSAYLHDLAMRKNKCAESNGLTIHYSEQPYNKLDSV